MVGGGANEEAEEAHFLFQLRALNSCSPGVSQTLSEMSLQEDFLKEGSFIHGTPECSQTESCYPGPRSEAL